MSSESDGMRLQKYLSRAGVASRREAEKWIEAGRVRVNGSPATTLGTRIDPEADRVEVDGRAVTLPEHAWLLLNKPTGTFTTRDDPGGRPTVYDLLPPEYRSLRYVGRLDRDTEGLLLFTNDGEAVHALLHPSSELPREYEAWVIGVPDRATLDRIEAGVELDDGPARAESVRFVEAREGKAARLRLVLREGRKREVRRLFDAVGFPVRQLRRIRFGPLSLDDTPTGEWRPLSDAEVEALRRAAGLAPQPAPF